MITKDALVQVSEIVSHASCPDGIGAAMIATAAYVSTGMRPPPTNFVQYGTRAHDDMVSHPRQLFLDITPPKGRWEEWRGLSPIVLDHHESAMHVVQGLNGVYGDSDHSGAMLAFANVMVPLVSMPSEEFEAWQRFAHLCMVRDTWKTASPDWAEACALAHALLLQGQRWGVNAAIVGKLPLAELLNLGRKLHDKIMRQSKGVVRNSLRRNLSIGSRDVKLAIFNHADGGTVSDIAHYVMDEMPCDIVVAYFYVYEDDDTRCVVSVRSNGAISASDLARSFGGGGQSKAAGFRIAGDMSPNSIIQVVTKRIAELNQ